MSAGQTVVRVAMIAAGLVIASRVLLPGDPYLCLWHTGGEVYASDFSPLRLLMTY